MFWGQQSGFYSSTHSRHSQNWIFSWMKQGLDSLAALWSGHWCTVLNWLFFFATKDIGGKVYFISEGPVAPQEGGANPRHLELGKDEWFMDLKCLPFFKARSAGGESRCFFDLKWFGGGNKEVEKNAWCDTHSGRLFGETAKVRVFVGMRMGACEKHFSCLFLMYSRQSLYMFTNFPLGGRNHSCQRDVESLETGTIGSTCSLRSWW